MWVSRNTCAIQLQIVPSVHLALTSICRRAVGRFGGFCPYEAIKEGIYPVQNSSGTGMPFGIFLGGL